VNRLDSTAQASTYAHILFVHIDFENLLYLVVYPGGLRLLNTIAIQYTMCGKLSVDAIAINNIRTIIILVFRYIFYYEIYGGMVAMVNNGLDTSSEWPQDLF